MDSLTPEKRSWNMSRIKSQDTKPEIILRKQLFARGIRFRLHSKGLPGRPDLILTKFKAVIFVNGCFWHMHARCKNAKIPSTRHEFWKQKLEGNRSRDAINLKKLLELDWRVLTVWECSLLSCRNDFASLIDEIVVWLNGNSVCSETTGKRTNHERQFLYIKDKACGN
jgi:DNA mismatch endonuclease, patch repair protein